MNEFSLAFTGVWLLATGLIVVLAAHIPFCFARAQLDYVRHVLLPGLGVGVPLAVIGLLFIW